MACLLISWGGLACVSCAEVTSRSVPRSAGGSRSKWTRSWSGRRAPPRRWRRELHPPRTWTRRRGLPRPGPGQSLPANTVKKKLTNELARVPCAPPPQNQEIRDLPPGTTATVTYMGLCFWFKPLAPLLAP